MPVGFLTEEQIAAYGQYSGEPSEEQLARYFYLDDADRAVVCKHRGQENKLCFALHLCTVRFLGTFLSDLNRVPAGAIRYVAAQFSELDTRSHSLMQPERTRIRHIETIKNTYGYKDFSDRVEVFSLIRWLYNRCTLSNERPGILFDLATARLVERKVLLPGATTLARLVSRVRGRAAKNLWSSLFALTTPMQQKRLEWLLDISEDNRQSHLDRLRKGPVSMSGVAVVEALARIEEIR